MAELIDLADLASEQWGLVTTAQAGHAGFSRQRIKGLADRGVLERLQHGVYRLTGAPPDPLDEIRSAWLMLDPGRPARDRRFSSEPSGVVSHRTAAALVHRLGDLDADQIEFTVNERRQSRRPDVRFHQRPLDAGEWGLVDGLPVTTVVRTIVDLAAARTDGGHLAGVVRDGLTTDRVDADQLIEALRPYAHYYGVPLGDGEALVRRFLEEAGVPKGPGRAVDLVTPTLADQMAKLAAISEAAQIPASTLRIREVAEKAQLQLPEDLRRQLDQVSAVAEKFALPPATARQLAEIQRTIAAARPAMEQAERIARAARRAGGGR